MEHFSQTDILLSVWQCIAELDGTVFIHCAQGTLSNCGLFRDAYLIYMGVSASVDDGCILRLQRRPAATPGRFPVRDVVLDPGPRINKAMQRSRVSRFLQWFESPRRGPLMANVIH